MRMPPLLADFIHAGACIPICEKFLTRPYNILIILKNSQLLNFILLLLVSLSRKEKAPSTDCAKAMRRQHSMKGADILILFCVSLYE